MCDERERLIGYVYGESDDADRAEVDRHLDECDVCRSEIRGLRRTREDLLAWNVPEHGSVWTPFAPPAPAAWYRQVPAWAMAAAASVMFIAGAAGGAVTQAVMAAGAPVEQRAATGSAEPRGQAIPASVTVDQLTDVERRLIQMLRQELDQRLASETTALSASNAALRNVSNPGVGIEQLRGLETTQAELLNLFTSFANDFGRINEANAAEFQRLDRKVDTFANAVALTNASAPRGPGNQ